MKLSISAIFIIVIISTGYGQANTTLSNLTSPTAINQSLIPNNNDVRDLGSAAKSWRTLYIDSSIYLKDILFIQNKGVQNTFIGEDAGRVINNGKSNAVFGYRALYTNKNGSSNTALGSFALFKNTAANNTAVGYQALYSNTTATLNTAIGYQALYSNTTGSPNTAVGWGALYSNTIGTENTAIGQGALYQNVAGNWNVAVGRGALFSNINPDDNTAIGFKALFFNSGINEDGLSRGSQNTAIGSHAMEANTRGLCNTAVGAHTMQNITEGLFNTAIGRSAFGAVTIGTDNTGLGDEASVDLGDASGNVVVGSLAHVYGSNSIVIGYNAYTNTNNLALLGSPTVAYCGGYVGWTTYASDKRIKKEVKENVKGLEFINRLRPVTYHLDLESLYKIQGISRYGNRTDKTTATMKADIDKNIKDKEAVLNSGFIAQEVEKAARESGYDFDGVKKPQNDKDNYGLTYATFVVPLVKAVQELSKMNDNKDSIIQLQNIKIDNLENRLAKIESLLNTSSENIKLSSASLQQNVPNPFTHSTSIGYNIPTKFSSARIVITDKTGKTIKAINISNNNGNIKVDASTLASGAYQYSLVVDRKLIETKQMILL